MPQIPRLKEPISSIKWSDDEAKIFSLIKFVSDKIEDDSDVHELEGYQRTIYCLERLSQQINIDGFQNFFDYGIAILYREVLDALHVINALELAALLAESKKIIFGDEEVTELTEPLPEQLEALTDRGYEAGLFDDFHAKFKAFVTRCFDEHDFSLAS